MPSALTDTLKDLVLDWVNGVGSPTRPTTPLQVILYTTMPNVNTGLGGVEPVGFGYLPTDVTFSAAASGATSNVDDVVFPTPTGGRAFPYPDRPGGASWPRGGGSSPGSRAARSPMCRSERVLSVRGSATNG